VCSAEQAASDHVLGHGRRAEACRERITPSDDGGSVHDGRRQGGSVFRVRAEDDERALKRFAREVVEQIGGSAAIGKRMDL